MAFTRMLQFAKCTASHCVKFETAALAPLYAGIFVSGVNAFIEEIFTMQPPVSSMSVANACVVSSVPRKFRLNTNETPSWSRSKNDRAFSSSISSLLKYSLVVVPFGLLPPAPLMSTSHGPNFSSTTSCAFFRLSLSSTFACTAMALPPALRIPSASRFAASKLRSSSAILCPSAASAREKALQSTPPAPVMTIFIGNSSLL